MSLANRITLLVVVLLVVSGAGAAVAFYGSVRRSMESELEARLNTRLVWLEGALVGDVEDGELELKGRREPSGAAAHWRVALSDGRVLWASAAPGGGADVETRETSLGFGVPGRPVVTGREVVHRDGEPRRDDDADDLPPAVRDAVRAAFDGFVVTDVDRRRGRTEPAGTADAAIFLEGVAGGREYRLELAADGTMLGIESGDHVEYRFPPGRRRLELVLVARTPRADREGELGRLAGALRTVGPLALAVAGVLLALLIRWQLSPLARMADEAGGIGPANVSARMGPVGTSAECVRLRDSINSMLERLAEGLARERRFASTAAHELRTPLAELKTTIEVALRRERDAGEYRAALADSLSDVERLEMLVRALLALARSSERGRASGRPVRLAALLRKAAAECGPVRFSGGRVDEHVDEGLTVGGEEALLLGAVCNVLENAKRYAPGEPPEVRVDVEGERVLVVVADHGPGVPEADRERIFEPLTRLDGAWPVTPGPQRCGLDARPAGESAGPPADTADGFGLGLAVARSTVRAFGGDLVCRARADGASGAEFVFSFLACPAAEG